MQSDELFHRLAAGADRASAAADSCKKAPARKDHHKSDIESRLPKSKQDIGSREAAKRHELTKE